jgi:2-keto-4-pentenoate hydratase
MTSIDPVLVNRIANELIEAELLGKAIAPIRVHFPNGDIDSAYAIQKAITADSIRRGRRIVGRKVGLTNPAVQQQLGVNQPDFGVLFDDMQFPAGGFVPYAHVLQPRIETEMAFILGSDLDSVSPTLEQVAAAVEAACVSFEIVGSRIANWDIGIVDTVADNASSGAFVLSDLRVPLSQIDLTGATMSMQRAGVVVSSGVGAACLGSPVLAAQWLATELSNRGEPLRRGDVVLTGALGPMVAVNPGDSFSASVDGLGSITISFGNIPS